MAKLATVKIEKDGIEGEVTREALKAWERNGWTAVDDGSSDEPAEAPAIVPAQQVRNAPKTDSAKADETKKENG